MVIKTPFEHNANVAQGFEEAMRDVSVPSHYSPSIFTLEVNGKPTFAFRAKWQAEAERLGKDWVYSHRDQISTKGSHGTELPPGIKVRIARASERAAFATADGRAELYGGGRIAGRGEVAARRELADKARRGWHTYFGRPQIDPQLRRTILNNTTTMAKAETSNNESDLMSSGETPP